MKMMQGAFFLPWTKRSRTREAPTPTNISTKSEPLIEKNGHARLAGDAAREQRLARARRADEQHALRDAPAELGELLRVLEERDDLFELFLGLVDAGDVVEGDLVLVLGEELGAALPERHRLAAADLHLAHEEHPEADQQDHREPVDEEDVPEGLGVLAAGVDADALGAEVADELGVRQARRSGTASPLVLLAVEVLTLDRHLGDLALVDSGEEVAEDHLLVAGRLLREDVHEQQDHENQEEPEREIPRELIHRSVTFTYRHGALGEGTIGGTRTGNHADSFGLRITRRTSKRVVVGPTSACSLRPQPGTQTIFAVADDDRMIARRWRGTWREMKRRLIEVWPPSPRGPEPIPGPPIANHEAAPARVAIDEAHGVVRAAVAAVGRGRREREAPAAR